MILKGQNFRIFSGDSVIGMATNCTVTLTGNSEDATHKDIVGIASLPTIVSKGWQVSVESLDVTDTAAMLTAIKNMPPFTLRWDETSTTDNQTGLGAAFARTGQAYLNDATFTWNDRAISTKSLQFTGTGPLTKVTNPTTDVITVNNTFTKGQFVRLFVGSDNTAAPAKVVAAARQLCLHICLRLESASNKDTDGDWDIQQPTGLSYDITSNALMRSNDTITSSVGAQTVADIEDIYEGAVPVKWVIANVSGANQRTKGAAIVSGSCVITSLVLNGPDRQNADYNATFNGYGPYSVGA